MYRINSKISKRVMQAAALVSLIWPAVSFASVVRMATAMGDIEIELFDSVAPLTVSNFMNYVNNGNYTNSFIHRSVPGFIIQGGGYTFENNLVYSIPKDAPVVNEFSLSNTRGTIAMAKLAGDPNSATSEWFINLADNSGNLDFQNGGFTVFGQVLGNGMDIVDAIAALPLVNAGGAFGNLPVINYIGGAIQRDNLVMINSVSAVPLPGAVWLLGSGLLGLVGVARRKAA